MRDHADNVVVICSIENFDPMGVHTGDSITVAPAQTLTDVEYQRMRDAAFACIRRIGVDTGGSNIQFAREPGERRHGRDRDEPARVAVAARSRARRPGSRSPRSRRASRSGYRLDEIMNDITGETPASFEPTIDYVVTKVPRWAFEKLPGRVAGARHDDAVGRRGDGDRPHVPRVAPEGAALARDRARRAQRRPGRARATTRVGDRRARAPRRDAHAGAARSCVEAALRRGVSVERLHDATGIDPWFLDQHLAASSRTRARLRGDRGLDDADRRDWRRAKRLGFGDAQLAYLWGVDERRRPRRARLAAGVAGHVQDRRHVRGRVRGEHAVPLRHLRGRGRGRAARPARGRDPRAAGPNRIGQGVEFDYCCVHAAFALSDAGLRDGDGQLQPRDRLHRLRHQRPPLLRAAHASRTSATSATRCGASTARRQLAGRGRRARWPDAAEARARARGRGHPGARHQPRRRSTSPRTASGSTRCASASGSRSRRAAPRPTRRAARADRRASSASRCSCGRRTCSAGARCRSSTTTTSLDAAMAELAADGQPRARRRARRPSGRCSIDRFLEDAIEVDVDALRDADRRGRHRRRDGAHRGGRRALGRLRVRDPAADARPPRPSPRSRRTPARSPTRSTCAVCSTCSTR